MSTTLAFDIIARDRASSKFNDIGSSAEKSSGKLKAFAKVGALAAAGAAIMVGKALVDMTKAAMEDQAAQVRLATALKNSTGANKQQVAGVEKWITAQGKALGVTDDELRPALSRLAVATGDVGKAQKLAALAMDVSAGTGKSLSTVTEALMKAQNGSLGGLSRLGVATKDAAGETKSLKQITQELATLHGGQAAAQAETTAGKMKRLKLMYDETKESIGAKLIPVATQLADFALTRLAPALSQVGDWIKTKLMPPLQQFAQDMAPKARDVMQKVGEAFNNAKPFLAVVGTLMTNVLLPIFGKFMSLQWAFLGKQIEGLGIALGAVGRAGVVMWNQALQPAFRFMANAIATVLGKLGEMFSAMGSIKGAPAWIGQTGAALTSAAEKAANVAASINKIPTSKTVRIDVWTVRHETKEQQGGTPGFASGTPYAPGGMALVGERGPELVNLPRGSRVHDAQATAAMGVGVGAAAAIDYRRLGREIVAAMQEGAPLVRLENPGHAAYLRGGAR